MNFLVIIPARGGSVGIPRKNLRPLNGKPLIYYSINTAKKSKYKLDIYVSSEDDEILMFAERFGASVHRRDRALALSETTLDPVIFEAYKSIREKVKVDYDFVITLQPTSPLLSEKTLDDAIDKILQHPKVDVIISAKEERHLNWRNDGGSFHPNYKQRLNRQFLEPYYTETGSFVICKAENLHKTKLRITGNTDIYVLPKNESVDIDDYDDWAICEFYLKRKKILINVVGNKEVGLGHIYRCLVLAHEIIDHEIIFLVDEQSELGYIKIRENNFSVIKQDDKSIIEYIDQINPDLVINDTLDTDEKYIRDLIKRGIKVVNFEDLGKGALLANIVINALYPEEKSLPKHYSGYKYFCARDEFINTRLKEIKEVEKILISFGGTDPNNLTMKVLQSIYAFCFQKNIQITVILGLGYNMNDIENSFNGVKFLSNIVNISDYFLQSDLIFTSAGRTVYEIACIGTPTIILAQNKRELTHLFGTYKNGFINMGLGKDISQREILSTLINLIDNEKERKKLNKRMLSFDLKSGKVRTIKLIRSLIQSN